MSFSNILSITNQSKKTTKERRRTRRLDTRREQPAAMRISDPLAPNTNKLEWP